MPVVNIFSGLDEVMTRPWHRIYVGERLLKEPLCPNGAMVYASDRFPVQIVGVRKLLGDLIRPMTMSAEDEIQVYITSEQSHGDAMPRKLAGSCNGEAQLLTCQSIGLVYGRLVTSIQYTM